MHEGVLHIRDVEGPNKTGSVEARLGAMEQQVFKCQGMVERGLNANHLMIVEFTYKHKLDTKNLWDHVFKIYEKIEHLQAQISDLQNQNWYYNEVQGSGPLKRHEEGDEDVDVDEDDHPDDGSPGGTPAPRERGGETLRP
ncbi:40S ribosomal protein S5-1 [Hordeum vulgare]|nr:40S ribosomal protein S5-1 [Hordeum vulgare]